MARKSPAFSFYPDSWLGGTALMTDEERGVYIQLLAINWLSGSLSFSHALAITFARDSALVKRVLEAKFVQDDDGNWFNERLEDERKKQMARSENGQKGAEKRWSDGKPHSKHDGKSNGKPHGKCDGETMHSDSDSDSDSITDTGSVVVGGLVATCDDSKPSSPPSDDDSGFLFAMQSGTYNLPKARLSEYKATYPFDVETELNKASFWLRDNKNRRPATAMGIKKFLTGWLNRTHERTRTQPSTKTQRTLAALQEFVANG
jgi:uncharacterized protein YdaU (DUF1376 family)